MPYDSEDDFASGGSDDEVDNDYDIDNDYNYGKYSKKKAKNNKKKKDIERFNENVSSLQNTIRQLCQNENLNDIIKECIDDVDNTRRGNGGSSSRSKNYNFDNEDSDDDTNFSLFGNDSYGEDDDDDDNDDGIGYGKSQNTNRKPKNQKRKITFTKPVIIDENLDAKSKKNTRKKLGKGDGDEENIRIDKNYKREFPKFDFNPVIVVDYDLTLVDNNAKPFPGSKKFLEKLRNFNDGHNTLVLYSHANSAHINHGLDKYFNDVKHYFDEIISDHSARNNKPVTHVRRVISKISYLTGPFIIIDDLRSNLDNDQYDIVVDVNRFTKSVKNDPVNVDYDGIFCLIKKGIEKFLITKTPNLKKN